MSRLEQAIKKARLSISEGDSEIVLDRSVFASRKSGKLAEVTLYESHAARNKAKSLAGDRQESKTLSVEGKYWKNKFEMLKRERNEEEEDLVHLIELTAEREAKLIELARLLERKIDLISTTNSNENAVYAKLESQRKVLRMYEIMTAMTVVESDKRDGVMLCTAKNHMRRILTRFSIEMPSAEDGEQAEVLYAPLANINLLPDYLQNKITCEKPMVPVMLGDILQSLFEEEENEDEDEEDD